MKLPPGVSGEAVVSPCGTYRYHLTRRRDPNLVETMTGTALWVMLNPSSAEADVDDPTLRRVQQFSWRGHFRRAVVVNLFALRATNPVELRRHPDPVGPANDSHIALAAERADAIYVAWGAGALFGRDRQVAELLRRHTDRPLLCLGTTAEGHPRHPLYLQRDAIPQEWTESRSAA